MHALGTSKTVFAAHGAIVLLPQFDARRYVEAIGRFGVTFLTSVPTRQQLIDAVKPGFPIWTHFLLPLTLLSEPRALQPGMSPSQNSGALRTSQEPRGPRLFAAAEP
jgi:hypothetical protein